MYNSALFWRQHTYTIFEHLQLTLDEAFFSGFWESHADTLTLISYKIPDCVNIVSLKIPEVTFEYLYDIKERQKSQ